MKVYVLDIKDKKCEQLQKWMKENKNVNEIEFFEDCTKFVKQVSNSSPEICIIRLGGNRIPGFKTARLVHEVDANIKVVFISDSRDHAVDAYEEGAYGYLVCPIDRDKLEKNLIIYKK